MSLEWCPACRNRESAPLRKKAIPFSDIRTTDFLSLQWWEFQVEFQGEQVGDFSLDKFSSYEFAYLFCQSLTCPPCRHKICQKRFEYSIFKICKFKYTK